MSPLLHDLAKWAEQNPNHPAQRYKEAGQWKTLSARDYWEHVFAMALFLESRGIGVEDVSIIFAYNCPEWVHTDLGMILLGAKSSGLYPNASLKDIEFILSETKARVLAVQDREYFLKITGPQQENPLPAHVELIIVYDGDTSISSKAVSYEDAIRQGMELAKYKKPDYFLARLNKDSGAFLVYTSGTTGNPKGAMVSLDNLAFVSQGAIQVWNLPVGKGDLFSFLPLCHVAEKEHGIGVGILGRLTVSFCSNFDSVSSELAEVQPKLLLSVPRLWEKMMEGVEQRLADAPSPRQQMARWAMAVGERVTNARIGGEGGIGFSDLIQYKLADRLVLSKVRKALGLGNSIACASGAAALPENVVRWFRKIGVRVLNTLGQTECSGAYVYEMLGGEGIGTVGVPLPGAEIKIAEDGEIWTRGRHVFKGYFKNPKATDETFTDGWFRTGDIGEFRGDGSLVVRGRKKEVLKTSGGKMVAPLPIEEKIKESPMIAQVCMVGEGRKFISALITLSEAEIKKAKDKPGAIGEESVVTDPDILARIQRVVDGVNANLAGYEKVKSFVVLAREFTVDSGEMTATLKLKRHIVERKFSHLIDQLYLAA